VRGNKREERKTGKKEGKAKGGKSQEPWDESQEARAKQARLKTQDPRPKTQNQDLRPRPKTKTQDQDPSPTTKTQYHPPTKIQYPRPRPNTKTG
jgi:hypothetical protein